MRMQNLQVLSNLLKMAPLKFVRGSAQKNPTTDASVNNAAKFAVISDPFLANIEENAGVPGMFGLIFTVY